MDHFGCWSSFGNYLFAGRCIIERKYDGIWLGIFNGTFLYQYFYVSIESIITFSNDLNRKQELYAIHDATFQFYHFGGRNG